MSEIVASFEVNATHTIKVEAGTADLTPDQIAELVYELDPGISICHQCADDVDGAETGDLVEFSVDGVTYVSRGGKWVKHS